MSMMNMVFLVFRLTILPLLLIKEIKIAYLIFVIDLQVWVTNPSRIKDLYRALKNKTGFCGA